VKAPGRQVFSVSEITGRIVARLESGFPDVWVKGELGDLTRHSSGHWYFSLKDRDALLRCVMFRSQARFVRFDPREGDEILCRGRVTGYAPRSLFQLNVEYLEPAGVGALYAEFERLKKKLSDEGLFDPARKRPLPGVIRRVAIITSSSGAALYDMLRALKDRDPDIEVLALPAAVQGATAASELRRMLELANRPEVATPPDRRPLDVIIIGRGGGSPEDLAAFNDENLARAIAASNLPVISAVGHEVDFTIADFVADLRAPTPTAAAQMVSTGRPERVERLSRAVHGLAAALGRGLAERGKAVGHLTRRLRSPLHRVLDLIMRTDDLDGRLRQATIVRLEVLDRRIEQLERTVISRDPRAQNAVSRERLTGLVVRLRQAARRSLELTLGRLDQDSGRLAALSPLATLERGYAIARRTDGRVVREAGSVAVGEDLELVLHRGSLGVAVKCVRDGEKDKR